MPARAFFAGWGGREETILTIIALGGLSLHAKLSLNERRLSANFLRPQGEKCIAKRYSFQETIGQITNQVGDCPLFPNVLQYTQYAAHVNREPFLPSLFLQFH
jgi:hypothetical protein